MRNFALLALSVAVLSACGTRPPAPVVDRTVTPSTREPVVVSPPVVVAPAPPPVVAMPPAAVMPDNHAVRRGETLFSIARLYGLNQRDLAQWNALPIDAVVREGQLLRLTSPVVVAPPTIVATPIPPAPSAPVAPSGEVKREPKGVKIPYTDEAFARIRGVSVASVRAGAPMPAAAPTPAAGAVPVAPSSAAPAAAAPAPASGASVAPPSVTNEADAITWAWPAPGRVTKKFSETSLLRGVSVEGRAGAPVFASAAGRVIYAGEGLRGYGKVVILRHNDQYTSVYGHNSNILVKENESVRRGQKIAEVGDTETDGPKLHFEVRRGGKAVDPEKLLPAR